MNLKLKFLGYNEKYMGFHMTLKKVLLGWALGDENAMGIRAFKEAKEGLAGFF